MGNDMRMILGDARVEIAKLPDRSIDVIVTDPPYGHSNNDGDLIHKWEKATGKNKQFDKRHGGRIKREHEARPIANDGGEANDVFREVLSHFPRLLREGGCCCCCCCGGGGPDPQFARWSLWLDEVLQFKQMIVWDKGPMGLGWHYRRSYETVLVAQKPGAKCRWYDETDKIENIIRPGARGIRKIIPSKTCHPTPKPVELALHFLKLHAQPGDTVLDPFMGAGWVAVAAKQLKMKFIGIEIDPHWYGEAQKRVRQMRKGFLFHA